MDRETVVFLICLMWSCNQFCGGPVASDQLGLVVWVTSPHTHIIQTTYSLLSLIHLLPAAILTQLQANINHNNLNQNIQRWKVKSSVFGGMSLSRI